MEGNEENPESNAPAEVAPAEVPQAEAPPAEVPAEKSSAEVVPVEVAQAEIAPAEVAPAEVVVAEVAPAEVAPAEVEVAPTIVGGTEVLDEGSEEGEGEQTDKFTEGGLFGKEEESSSSSSSYSISESDEEEEDLDEEGVEEEEKKRRRKRKRVKTKTGEEEEEEEEEAEAKPEGLEEEEDEDLRGKPGMSSQPKIKEVVSGFDLDMGDDDAEEESSESSESEPTPLIREPFYAVYLQNMRLYGTSKRLNNFFHKRMAEYFKKRKMEHVLREMAEHLDEAKIKYGRKLDNFYQLIELDKSQRESVNADLKVMKQMREEQVNKAQNSFMEFQEQERDTGIGLINSKTGKEIPDKAVDKLLGNQKTKGKEIQNLRLLHFKIRNAVADKHASIKAMDRIGENYTLIEFEQMKIENQAHMDKIEEKEDELSKLRKKCSGAIQCLAHVREKCSAGELNIRNMKDKLEIKDYERAEARERMNALKQGRDNHRHETQRLKQENGLLTKDKLLIDMEDSMKETMRLKAELKTRTKNYERKKEKLKLLKENYEKEKKRRKPFSTFSKGKSLAASLGVKSSVRIVTGRPSLFEPKFDRRRKD